MSTDTITRHPLSWPAGQSRTSARARPLFKPGGFAASRDHLLAELRRHRASGVALSTNVELRRDGLPLANQRQPADPGVAVYFRRKGRDLCLACDRWTTVEANMRAVADVIEALRLIGRRGTGDLVDQAFSGFAALPPGPSSGPRPWWEVFGVFSHISTEAVTDRYRKLVLEHHPDRNGGDVTKMVEINAAFEGFKTERGL
jgi:hypothetical protein